MFDTAQDVNSLQDEAFAQDVPAPQETIGLFGSRGGDFGVAQVPTAQKLARMKEIVQIASRYNIFRGLTPQSFRQLLEELGPTFVKAGQILSMRSEILPQAFCDELSQLRTHVEPMSRDTVLEALRAEYATPIEDIFDAIDDVPLGSASVAQVHKARLVTGELVAIKVQRPHVREIMAQDIAIMRSLAKRSKRLVNAEQFLDLQSVINELWQSFREETDFLVEAKNLEEFRRNNADCAYISSPKPYLSLCTEHVVVMDYIEGIPLNEHAQLVAQGYDLQEIGTKLVDNYTTQILDEGFFHADPHPGNIVVKDGKIVYLDLGMMGRLSSSDRAAMREMVLAVANRDSAQLKEGLLSFSVGDIRGVDHPDLLADLDHIIANYGEVDLSELDLGAFINALIAMAQKNGIELPGSVTMLARSLVTLEGVVDGLLPGISIITIIQQHIKDSISVSDFAKHEVKKFERESLAATHSLLGAASQTNTALNMLTRGQLKFNVGIDGNKDPIGSLAHAVDRLTMGIIIAGLFIGSSVVYYARIQPVIFGIPVIGFAGYLIALGIGLWVVRQIMLEEKHRNKH